MGWGHEMGVGDTLGMLGRGWGHQVWVGDTRHGMGAPGVGWGHWKDIRMGLGIHWGR